jgi:hypothetical protein
MERGAILAIINDWLFAVAEADTTLAWVRDASLRPALPSSSMTRPRTVTTTRPARCRS